MNSTTIDFKLNQQMIPDDLAALMNHYGQITREQMARYNVSSETHALCVMDGRHAMAKMFIANGCPAIQVYYGMKFSTRLMKYVPDVKRAILIDLREEKE